MAGQSPLTRQLVAEGCEAALTFREAHTADAQEALVVEFMAKMGWRIERVGADEFLIPTDRAHPDYVSCARRIERAKRRAG